MPHITVDATLCRKCGACAATCPAGVFLQPAPGDVPVVTPHRVFCIACGHCTAICAVQAVRHDAFPAPPEPVNESGTPSYDAVLELMRKRRSVRAFANKPVSQDMLDKLLAAAATAPHAHNNRTTAVIVVRDPVALADITALTSAYFRKVAGQLRNPLLRAVLRLVVGKGVDAAVKMLPELDMLLKAVDGGMDMILHKAPCVMLFHAPARAPFAEANVQLALQNVALAAEALGLGGFYTGFVIAACQRDNAIARRFDVPAGHRLFGGFAFGHPRFPFHKWVARPPLEVRTF